MPEGPHFSKPIAAARTDDPVSQVEDEEKMFSDVGNGSAKDFSQQRFHFYLAVFMTVMLAIIFLAELD